LQAPAELDSKKSKAHVAKRNQIHRSGIFHREWKQGLRKHASGQPWQEQHQPLDIWSAFHTPRADDGIKKIMARISRHHHGRNGTLRSAPDLGEKLSLGTPTPSSASATFCDDSAATRPSPVRQNARPILAFDVFKGEESAIKYQ
jgi:hypothetical protein